MLPRTSPSPGVWLGLSGAAVAAERLSRGSHEGEQLVSDPSCWVGGVYGERAMPEHLRLEHGPATADLASARLAPAWRMERIVTVQPGLLRRPVDMEQEHAVEQIQHFVLVAGDAQMKTARSCLARISSIRPRLYTQRCDPSHSSSGHGGPQTRPPAASSQYDSCGSSSGSIASTPRRASSRASAVSPTQGSP